MSKNRAKTSSSRAPKCYVRRTLTPAFTLALIAFWVVVSAFARPRTGQESSSDSGSTRGAAAQSQASFATLAELANEQVRTDPSFLGRMRFKIDPQAHTLFLDLSPVPQTFVLSKGDPDGIPLESLIRLASLRRDFQAAFPDERSWSSQLDSIERIVQQCDSNLDHASPATFAHVTTECSSNTEQGFDGLRKSVESYANAHGLKSVAVQPRGVGFPVRIVVVPPRARIRVITMLEYKKYESQQTPKDKYEWIDLIGSENEMIGRYHYRAEWPPDLKGAVEGDIEITGPQMLTFSPPPQ